MCWIKIIVYNQPTSFLFKVKSTVLEPTIQGWCGMFSIYEALLRSRPFAPGLSYVGEKDGISRWLKTFAQHPAHANAMYIHSYMIYDGTVAA